MLNNFTSFSDKIKSIPPSSRIYNLTGSSMALFFAMQEKPFIMVEATEETAEALYKDILFFRSVLHLNETNGLFFLPEPDGPDACGKRADVVYRFRYGASVVTSNAAAKAPLWGVSELENSALILKQPLEISRDVLEQKLVYLGYKQVPIVVEHGEFSRRGWLFDIFPSTGENPLRAEFFGDVIETIKMFDVSTQKSIRKIEEFTVLPSVEHLEAGNIFSVFKDANCFYSDSIHHPCDFSEGAVMLSKFSFSTIPHSVIPPHPPLEKGGRGDLIKGCIGGVLAVTGTNGKSTTTALLDFMMKRGGFETILGGNIGNALTEEILKIVKSQKSEVRPPTCPPLLRGGFEGGCSLNSGLNSSLDFIVAEVSSFQLESIKDFRPKVASILNITPDHLDRYHSIKEYSDAKARIFENQKEDDFLVINWDDPETMKVKSEKLKVKSQK